jgi:uncharacterized membrane protein YeiH
MAVAAALGAHVARRRQIPLLGVVLAGVIGGLGGGMVRDVLLGLEPAAITTWYYIPAVLAAAIAGGSLAPRVSLKCPLNDTERRPGGDWGLRVAGSIRLSSLLIEFFRI